MAHVPWIGAGGDKLYMQSGEFTSVIKTSVSISSIDGYGTGIEFDGVNTLWCGYSNKLFLQSGSFTTTLKTSISLSNAYAVPQGISSSWIADYTTLTWPIWSPHTIYATEGLSPDPKLYEISSQFSTTVKNSLSITGVGASVSWTQQAGYSGNTLFGIASDAKLKLLSGKFSSTIKTSQGLVTYPTGVSWDGEYTLWCGSNDKLYYQSGLFSSTVVDSEDVSSIDNIVTDISTTASGGRVGAGPYIGQGDFGTTDGDDGPEIAKITISGVGVTVASGYDPVGTGTPAIGAATGTFPDIAVSLSGVGVATRSDGSLVGTFAGVGSATTDNDPPTIGKVAISGVGVAIADPSYTGVGQYGGTDGDGPILGRSRGTEPSSAVQFAGVGHQSGGQLVDTDDVVWCGTFVDKLYLQSGQFSGTIKSSISLSGNQKRPTGVSFSNTIDDPTQSTYFSTVNDRLWRTSGQFTSTVRNSVNVNAIEQQVTGISSDGTNTLWAGAYDNNLYLQSGKISTTLKLKQNIGNIDGVISGISWDGINTPWCGQYQTQLYIQSGQFTSTLKTSINVGDVASKVLDISWNGVNTLWSGNKLSVPKLFMQSGMFASTLKSSLDLSDTTSKYAHGLEANNFAKRIAGDSYPQGLGTAQDTPWAGAGRTKIKLYLTSGQFSSTILTSRTVSSATHGQNSPLTGIEWDGTNTPWSSGHNQKLYLQSGQFFSTIKASLDLSSVDTNPSGISSTADLDTPWSGNNSNKLYLSSGQFTSTIKISVSVNSADTNPEDISWDGTNVLWCGSSTNKTFLQSGSFTSTIKTSHIVQSIDNHITGISSEISGSGKTTIWCGSEADKLYVQSGQFASTIKTSQYIGDVDTHPVGISTNNIRTRLDLSGTGAFTIGQTAATNPATICLCDGVGTFAAASYIGYGATTLGNVTTAGEQFATTSGVGSHEHFGGTDNDWAIGDFTLSSGAGTDPAWAWIHGVGSTIFQTNTVWCGNWSNKLYLQSGQFTGTIKTSQSVQSINTGLEGVSWDGTNTLWCGSESGQHLGGGDDKLYLQSGQFTATVKTSLHLKRHYAYGMSWDGANTSWVDANLDKLYLQSGQFASTIKTSQYIGDRDTHPRDVSWDGFNSPWCGVEANKLYLQSGQYSTTLKTSQTVAASHRPEGISWSGTDTLYAATPDSQNWQPDQTNALYLVSGQFSSTIKDSQNVGWADTFPQGIETNKLSQRLSGQRLFAGTPSVAAAEMEGHGTYFKVHDSVWAGRQTKKLYVQSGQYSSVVKTSLSLGNVGHSPTGVSVSDGESVTSLDTLWSDDWRKRLYRQSGQFSSTVKDSQFIGDMLGNFKLTGISFGSKDDFGNVNPDTSWCGITSHGENKLYLQSGQFSSTLKDSLTVGLEDGEVPQGISYDGASTLWISNNPYGTSGDKIVQQSGQFSSTIRDSIAVGAIDDKPAGVSWDGQSTLWAGGEAKLYLLTKFTSTVSTSLSVYNVDIDPQGIGTNNVEGRLSSKYFWGAGSNLGSRLRNAAVVYGEGYSYLPSSAASDDELDYENYLNDGEGDCLCAAAVFLGEGG